MLSICRRISHVTLRMGVCNLSSFILWWWRKGQTPRWWLFIYDPLIQCLLYTLDTLYSGHYGDVIMGTMPSQITSLTIVYSTVYSTGDQSKHQSSASLAFVWGIHRAPVNSPHKWPVTRKIYPFEDVIMGLNRFQSETLSPKLHLCE